MRCKSPVYLGAGKKETGSEEVRSTRWCCSSVSAKLLGTFKYCPWVWGMLGKRMFLVALVQAVFTQISSVQSVGVATGATEEQTPVPIWRRRKKLLPCNGG